ncbi:MAG: hypothetical protein H6Q26_785 [Bacteroidetes bacterium]|nr:hypothetical protein [Bacteroidota bacterium]
MRDKSHGMNRGAVINAFFTAVNTYYSLEKSVMLTLEKRLRIWGIPAGTNYLFADEMPVFISYIYQGLFLINFSMKKEIRGLKNSFLKQTFITSTLVVGVL